MRARKYSRGTDDYIKFVEYLKYHYLLMYAKRLAIEVDGEDARVLVRFSFKRKNGRLRHQFVRFDLRQIGGAWKVDTLGKKMRPRPEWIGQE